MGAILRKQALKNPRSHNSISVYVVSGVTDSVAEYIP